MSFIAAHGVINYAVHLLASGLLLIAFFSLYTRTTVYDEMALIHQGNVAAALSLGGALVGFSATLAAGIVYTSSFSEFLAWAVGAMVVQVIAYAIAARLLHMSKQEIESNNIAFGGLMGTISLAVGVLNAACLS